MVLRPETTPASEHLKEHKNQILSRWQTRAREEIAGSFEHTSLALVNSVPLLVDQLIVMLNPQSEETGSANGKALCIEHGIQRAQIGHYTLDQVIAEYVLLHNIIVESFEDLKHIRADELSKISHYFFEATRAAASSFIETRDEQARETEIQFKRLVEDAKELAIFILDANGFIKTWNEGATRLKQFTAEDVVGHHFRMLFRDEDRKQGRPENNLKLSLQNGRHEEQWWRIKKDGTLWWAEVIMTALYSSTGKHIGFSKIVRDLTERKRIDDELRVAKAAAEEASKLKSTFVANMSHEIRTPLGAILGFSELLRDPNLSNNERDEFVDIIGRNGNVLLRLVDDILDLSKIEAGKLEIENIEIPLRSILPEVVALFEIRAKEKGISLSLDINQDVPEYITTDPVRFRQILSNVIGNAVKFTETGGIQVLVAPSKISESSTGIEVFVTDSGGGIPAEKRHRIFGEFSQADATVTRKYGGTGLGLALSRRLARELGGDLELLDCPHGTGCTFKITITDRNAGAVKGDKKEVAGWKAAQSLDEAYPHIRGSKILFVEDSPDNQVLVKRFLSKAGAHVDIASNGAEGVEKASSGNYDVVLMDVQMPVLDGNEATRRLRESGFETPIVALSAHAMLEDRLNSIQAGCSDYLSKPINTKALLGTLEKWMVQATMH